MNVTADNGRRLSGATLLREGPGVRAGQPGTSLKAESERA